MIPFSARVQTHSCALMFLVEPWAMMSAYSDAVPRNTPLPFCFERAGAKTRAWPHRAQRPLADNDATTTTIAVKPPDDWPVDRQKDKLHNLSKLSSDRLQKMETIPPSPFMHRGATDFIEWRKQILQDAPFARLNLHRHGHAWA
jgi:hypothetical protein